MRCTYFVLLRLPVVLTFKYGVPEPGRLMGLCKMPAIELESGASDE
jgi:hypothetical protein